MAQNLLEKTRSQRASPGTGCSSSPSLPPTGFAPNFTLSYSTDTEFLGFVFFSVTSEPAHSRHN